MTIGLRLRGPLVVMFALLLAAPQGLRAEPLTGVTATKARATGFELPEVTAAAFGPGEHSKCSAGRLVLARGGKVHSIELTGGDDKQTVLSPLVGSALTSFIYDNHLVRMGDDLIYSVEGYTHQKLPCMTGSPPCPQPAWWDLFATHPAKGSTKPGARSAIWLFRSADCGVSWKLAGQVDAARLAVTTHTGQLTKGLCGPPRPREKMVCDDDDESENTKKDCPNEADQKFKKWAELGGFDGHYFAAHAESGRMVISTMCTFGTQLTPGDDPRYHILAVSEDGGANWSARVVPRLGDPKQRPVEPLTGMWRAPVLALNDDLWVFAYRKDGSVWVVADDPVSGTFAHDQAIKVAKYTAAGDDPDPIPLDAHFTSTSRDLAWNPVPVGSTKLPGLPTPTTFFKPLVQVASPSWTSGKVLRYRVHNVDLDSGNVTAASGLIAPADTDESVALGSFIQGERASLFYWLEELANGKFRVRYQIYHRGKPLLVKGFFGTQTPGIIQGANGEHTFTGNPEVFHGDYSNGAHYLTENQTEHFLLVWNENAMVSFADVSVSGLADKP